MSRGHGYSIVNIYRWRVSVLSVAPYITIMPTTNYILQISLFQICRRLSCAHALSLSFSVSICLPLHLFFFTLHLFLRFPRSGGLMWQFIAAYTSDKSWTEIKTVATNSCFQDELWLLFAISPWQMEFNVSALRPPTAFN